MLYLLCWPKLEAWTSLFNTARASGFSMVVRTGQSFRCQFVFLLRADLSANIQSTLAKPSIFLAFLYIGLICASLMETETETPKSPSPG